MRVRDDIVQLKGFSGSKNGPSHKDDMLISPHLEKTDEVHQ